MSHIPNEPTSESPIPAPEDPLNPPEDHHREPRLDKPAVEPLEEKKSLGRRMSEKLLPVYGPAQITDAKRPITPPTEEEQAREKDLQDSLTLGIDEHGEPYGMLNDPNADTDEDLYAPESSSSDAPARSE